MLVGAGLGDLQRQDVGQVAVGDHDRGGVDRGVADDPLEPLRDVDDLLGDAVAVDLGAQRRARRQAVLELRRAALLGIGDQLGQPVAGAVVVAEHARRVARGRPREHLAEGDDLRDRVLAVLLGHVADHALAAAHREVHVDVGHRHALGVEEPLEHQVVAQRVDIGDPQAVGDDRAGRRAAAGTDRDPRVLGVLDEVPDDQEVGVEAHPVDHAQLVVGALARGRGNRVAVAGAQPGVDQRAQVGALRRSRRASGSAGSAGGRARSRRCSARRSRRSRRSPRASRRSHAPSRRSTSDRTRWSRTASSARPASTWSARTAAPRGGRSPRAAGSGRRRCRPAAGPARRRSGRSPRCTGPGRRARSSAPRSRRCRGRRPPSAPARGRAPRPAARRSGAGRSATPGSP